MKNTVRENPTWALASRSLFRLCLLTLLSASAGMTWVIHEQAGSLHEHRVAEQLRELGLNVRFANHFADPQTDGKEESEWRNFLGD